MMDAEEMLALNRPRMMAEGGFAGMPLPGSAPSSAPAPGGQISGSATVVVALSPELRAAIVRDAIEGAVVRVEQDLRQDSRMSAAVKQLAT
jgi:hypothetical protein